jgi:hypothetical protein
MFLVEEKIGAAAVDEDDELLLVFWRLVGGAVAALLVPVVCSVTLVDIFERGGLVVILSSKPGQHQQPTPPLLQIS